ncbi:MAG: hypothetical protein U1E54_03400 [Candidatus Levybacteria bacterium]|nr:hypothetical protein [Candidatus Levybacteria bacterium]
MTRDSKGKFSKNRIGIILVLGTLTAIGFWGGNIWVDKFIEKTDTKIIEKDNLTPKIEELKKAVVYKLTEQCEYQGWTSESKPYKIEDNKKGGLQVVFGRWQFVPSTIIHYYNVLYGKKITEMEAVMIALDEKQAYKLTYDIIWKIKGGIWEWENCANKLNLKERIEFIKELENE